ncbi:DUF11 domain-containing protein [Spirosoma taeanense]|uniref:DUF11 domain-containing protein n=2 Tax=Spirosoma taeanense TaxID=2735870 RepID=A0A6M5YDX5_9BACT|nr:DUF11 domain-containing protein [Spirosoma taeanense]
MVFQRTLFNEASVLVACMAPSGATVVEARFVPLVVGQGNVTAWTPLDRLPASSAFRGMVAVTSGWYRLDVRAKADTTVLDVAHVNRVGVGEVFIIAGQSNVFGGFERVPSAEEDRVSCIDFRQDSLSEQLLPLQFSHVSYGTSIGPSQPPHLWGILGDRLVRKLNVPILFLGAALGGTSSEQWRRSAEGNIGPTPNDAVYRRLGAVLLHYVTRTGARAVLWHQGESDLSTSTQVYYDNIRYVIEKSRQQLGLAPLPWVMSRVSYINNQTNPSIIAAQNRLIAEVPYVFPGPATDSITGPENRPDGIHLQGPGLYRFVRTWEQSLDDNFFFNATPFTPADESSLLTSGYTLPIIRRPGESLAIASLRAVPVEADNQYFAQFIRADNSTTVYESARGTANPLAVTIPGNMPNGQYQFRTLTTHPATTGTLSEPFKVDQSAPPTSSIPPIYQPVSGGTADPGLFRFGYRYETESHAFWAMVRADVPMEIRLERIDGGPFDKTDWQVAAPSSTLPDYTDFADFDHIRAYMPIANGVVGVEPGRYRLSVRRQGDTGSGFWFEMGLLNGRNILYFPMESVPPLPPVITLTQLSPTSPCPGSSFSVSFEVTESPVAPGNTFTVQLSDADGSFGNPTTIGSGSGSPLTATLPAGLPEATTYRLRIVASNPSVSSAPSPPFTTCSVSGRADLSLNMRLSNRTVAIDQPVTCTLTLTNSGPQAATGVVIKNLLPNGLTFVDALSGDIRAANGIVTINANAIANGATQLYVFRLKAAKSGTFATAVQITASQTPDPDSQPGSGTGDGQDDAVTVDLRTTDRDGPLITSPNPNQTPLPDLRDNQPPVDLAKSDLRLSLSVSSQILHQNDVTTVNVQVSNRGGALTDSVTVQTLLPTGWQVTNSSGLIIVGQTVTGTLTNISPNQSATLTFPVRVTGSGTLRSQIQSATKADPDSTPGNGYATGEDDEASLNVRSR